MSKLGNLKKAELVGLANELGIEPEGVKSEIDSRISSYLLENSARFSTDPRFSNFYSPVKRRAPRRSPAPHLDNIEDRDNKTKLEETDDNSELKHSPEQSTPKEDKESEVDGDEEEEERDEEESEVEDSVSLGEQIKEKLADIWEIVLDGRDLIFERVSDYSNGIRSNLSNFYVIQAIELSLEAGFVIKTLIPRTYELKSHYIPLLSRSPELEIVKVPHLGVITSWTEFWIPFLFWLVSSVVIPFSVAYYVNFTATNTKKRGKSHRSHGFSFDPLTFSLTRIIITYGLHVSKISQYSLTGFCPDIFASLDDNSQFIEDTVGNLPYIAGLIGVVTALYIAAL